MEQSYAFALIRSCPSRFGPHRTPSCLIVFGRRFGYGISRAFRVFRAAPLGSLRGAEENKQVEGTELGSRLDVEVVVAANESFSCRLGANSKFFGFVCFCVRRFRPPPSSSLPPSMLPLSIILLRLERPVRPLRFCVFLVVYPVVIRRVVS